MFVAHRSKESVAMHSGVAWECPSVPESPEGASSLEVPASVAVPINMPALPGSIRSAASDAVGKARTIVLENDLPTAVAVYFSQSSRVLYPKESHKFSSTLSDSVVRVCLRDNPAISGSCQVIRAVTLRASKSFGSFGGEAQHFLQQETLEVSREQRLLQSRKKRMEEVEHEITIQRRWHRLCYFPLVFSCTLLGAGLLVLCIIVEPQDAAAAVGLSLAVVVLLCCFGLCGTNLQIFGALFSSSALKCLTFYAGYAFCILAALGVVAAVARFTLAGYWWTGLIAGLPCCCVSSLMVLYFSRHSLEENNKREEDEYMHSVAERTIVFHGSILEGGSCVASWPGKYESAWDSLVTESRGGDVSAAVVFLPAGSEHFGLHDPIPEAEQLEGSCWCIPIYGEQKSWGCRWWTKWMHNVQKAVEKHAELEVYFFEGMTGRGKIENFEIAGTQSMRREAILNRKNEFVKSSDFFSVARGIKRLSKKPRSDGSSQYSREVHRLFLAWLSEEDRNFMQESEGLGNSQKAEVAWLERKNIPFSERDVSTWVSRHSRQFE